MITALLIAAPLGYMSLLIYRGVAEEQQYRRAINRQKKAPKTPFNRSLKTNQ